MNIDLELDKLLEKYELKKENEIPYAVKVSQKHIIDMWNQIPKNYKIALWGAGTHTEGLLKLIENKNLIMCIIDNDKEKQGGFFDDIPIISKEDISKYEIDIIVISTMSYISEIKNEIKNLNYKYLDFYEEVCDNNIELEKINKSVLWFRDLKKDSRTKYISIFLLKNTYEKQMDNSNKELWLKEIIKEYFYIRDFINAKKYINEYIKYEFSNKEKYEKFLKELDNFLDIIEKKIDKRKNIDFIFNICDALRYDMVNDAKNSQKDLEFFHYISNNSIYYENAYANSTYTRAAFKAIFEEKLIIDDCGYKLRDYSLNINNSRLIKYFISKGYCILNNSNMKIESDRKNIYVINNVYSKNEFETCPEQLWKMISYFCMNKKSCFVINHFMESHGPYLGGENTEISIRHKKGDKKLKHICYEAVKYIDSQLFFYMRFFPKKSYKIFTSDHGQCEIEDQNKYNFYSSCDYVIKTPLIINNNKLEKSKIHNLFSKKDMTKLLINLHKNNIKLQYDIDYVEIQRDALYKVYEKDFEGIESEAKEKYKMGFKAIKSLDGKYVLYENGMEEFYTSLNDEKNEFNNSKYREIIDSLKSYLKNDKFYIE